MKYAAEINQATERKGLDRVGSHTVFSARWNDGDTTALVHRYRVIHSTQYGFKTIAAGDVRMDVGDILAEVYAASVKGQEVFAGEMPVFDLF